MTKLPCVGYFENRNGNPDVGKFTLSPTSFLIEVDKNEYERKIAVILLATNLYGRPLRGGATIEAETAKRLFADWLSKNGYEVRRRFELELEDDGSEFPPPYSHEDWRLAVSEGFTSLGYWAWVQDCNPEWNK